MFDWIDSSFAAAVISSMLTGGLAFLASWVQLKRMGVSASNAAEVVDRATFRDHMFRRVDGLQARVDEIEKLEEECQEEKRALARENMALERRVFELEKTVNGS